MNEAGSDNYWSPKYLFISAVIHFALTVCTPVSNETVKNLKSQLFLILCCLNQLILNLISLIFSSITVRTSGLTMKSSWRWNFGWKENLFCHSLKVDIQLCDHITIWIIRVNAAVLAFIKATCFYPLSVFNSFTCTWQKKLARTSGSKHDALIDTQLSCVHDLNFIVFCHCIHLNDWCDYLLSEIILQADLY
jgi:hypothetical protein